MVGFGRSDSGDRARQYMRAAFPPRGLALQDRPVRTLRSGVDQSRSEVHDDGNDRYDDCIRQLRIDVVDMITRGSH